MKKLDELGISPAPWSAKQDSGYDRETGDYNSIDTVCDATGKVLAEWWNGETYGEVYPNAEADARLITAAPKLYDALSEIVGDMCNHCDLRDACQEGEDGMSSPCNMVHKALAALAEAAGESEEVAE